ncbi:hypothetical protein Tco_1113087 [Tanacetum coccineum]|uniref:Reverse transcriptase domain-containing protein n=1 Tax=Tanacetum coccineum TaxID=301880 RepID=A0ABQ5IRG8_9ASTR
MYSVPQSRNQNRPQQQAPPVVVEPFNFEEPFDMAANEAVVPDHLPPRRGGYQFPASGLKKWKELCQPTLDGRDPMSSLFTAWERYKLSIDRCPNHNMYRDSKEPSYNGLTLRHRDTINAAAGGTFMKRRPEECHDLIENMTAHHNDWDNSAQRNESSSSITSSNPEITSLKLQMEEMNRNLTRVLQTNQQVNNPPHNTDW